MVSVANVAVLASAHEGTSMCNGGMRGVRASGSTVFQLGVRSIRKDLDQVPAVVVSQRIFLLVEPSDHMQNMREALFCTLRAKYYNNILSETCMHFINLEVKGKGAYVIPRGSELYNRFWCC